MLLELFQGIDGLRTARLLAELAHDPGRRCSTAPPLRDLAAVGEDGTSLRWQRYWRGNPVNAWIGGNLADTAQRFFKLQEDRFAPPFAVRAEGADALASLVQEIIDDRLATYEAREPKPATSAEPFR